MRNEKPDLSWREKSAALRRVVMYRPRFAFALVVFSGFVAFLEGVGLSFIYPIIEVARAGEPIDSGGPILEMFLATYEFFNVPLSLGYLILGVAAVMTVRFSSSFLTDWLASILGYQYEKYLRTKAFDRALGAKVGYYDQEGSDDILNAIITETRYSRKTIDKSVHLTGALFLVLMYIAVMLYISPGMTVLAIGILGGITIIVQFVVEPAVDIGETVAQANENVQSRVQAGTQGIRDVKLFNLRSKVYSEFTQSIDTYTRSSVKLDRNDAGIKNFFELSAAITIFALIYVGFTFTGLSIGELGIFLVAMFQLAPRVSRLNSIYYKLEGYTSHLVRTQQFLDELEEKQENGGDGEVERVSTVEFSEVELSYTDDEQVLCGVSFAVERNEFVAFIGQSGAGKSTIVSLLTRMYDPDSGEIRADGVPIQEYDIREWRDRIAVVRQDPYIFNTTLEENVTVSNRDSTRREVERVCEIAKVNEFIDELPNGYESGLGDEGVRLSGGQQQRVALARALLKDADFLVLDEATSDLDSNLEREVQDAIETMDTEYGIIAISHRLSTVQNADRIYTLDDGEIIEEGMHSELLADEGEYAELYTIQSSR
jgi:subfamily B ATP-binding cassette protein MsbA